MCILEQGGIQYCSSGARHSGEPDQGAADEVGRAEDGAQVQRDQLRECHQLTHRQIG